MLLKIGGIVSSFNLLAKSSRYFTIFILIDSLGDNFWMWTKLSGISTILLTILSLGARETIPIFVDKYKVNISILKHESLLIISFLPLIVFLFRGFENSIFMASILFTFSILPNLFLSSTLRTRYPVFSASFLDIFFFIGMIFLYAVKPVNIISVSSIYCSVSLLLFISAYLISIFKLNYYKKDKYKIIGLFQLLCNRNFQAIVIKQILSNLSINSFSRIPLILVPEDASFAFFLSISFGITESIILSISNTLLAYLLEIKKMYKKSLIRNNVHKFIEDYFNLKFISKTFICLLFLYFSSFFFFNYIKTNFQFINFSIKYYLLIISAIIMGFTSSVFSILRNMMLFLGVLAPQISFSIFLKIQLILAISIYLLNPFFPTHLLMILSSIIGSLLLILCLRKIYLVNKSNYLQSLGD